MAYQHYQNNKQPHQNQKIGNNNPSQSQQMQSNQNSINSNNTSNAMSQNNNIDQQYQKEFNALDADKSGYLDAKELRKLLGRWIPYAALKIIIKAADKNGDGKIGIDEYVGLRKQTGNIQIP